MLFGALLVGACLGSDDGPNSTSEHYINPITGNANIEAANIPNGHRMFYEFPGNVTGAPASIGDGSSMFYAAARVDIDLGATTLNVSSKASMFYAANGVVDITNATIMNGEYMFNNFLGDVAGAPASIGIGSYMFARVVRVEIDLGATALDASSYGYMFYGADGAVDITNATIPNGESMFNNFRGNVTGAPASIGTGVTMFAYAAHVEIDLGATALNASSKASMFYAANGVVDITNATIPNGEYMFNNFLGNVTGAPASIGIGSSSMFAYAAHVEIDLGATALNGSSYGYMFTNANGAVDIDGATIPNGNDMFNNFLGNVTGAPASIGRGTTMFANVVWVEIDLGATALDGEYYGNMFKAANGAVDITNATIMNGEYMFNNFLGDVAGAPASIGIGSYMFARVVRVEIDLGATALDTSSKGDMFRDADGVVDIAGAVIPNGIDMFFNFRGNVTGAPVSITNGDGMFGNPANPGSQTIDLRGTEVYGDFTKDGMFVGSTARVLLEGTRIHSGANLFKDFKGTTFGGPIFNASQFDHFDMGAFTATDFFNNVNISNPKSVFPSMTFFPEEEQLSAPEEEEESLSAGAIAGITIGCLITVGVGVKIFDARTAH